MNKFRLCKSYNTTPNAVTLPYKVVYDNGKICDYVSHVSLIVDGIKSIKDDDKEMHYSTDSNITVLKGVYQNSKGYYYNTKLSKGYGASTQRVYLTDTQVQELQDYIIKMKEFLKGVVLVDGSSYQELPSN